MPPGKQEAVARACFRLLEDEGHLLIAVPGPTVEKMLAVFKYSRMVEDPSIKQAYGLTPRRTLTILNDRGLALVEWEKFQWGLNNLIVFQKPSSKSAAW
jgi:hypothetical protein